MRRLYPLIIPVVALVAGCQSVPVSYDTPYDNPNVLPPPGTIIQLNQALEFSPGNSRSRIQNGKRIGKRRYDRFTPWCEFYLYESKEAMKVPRSIQPDRFTVTRAFQNVEYVRADQEPLQVAYVGIGVGVGYPMFPGSAFDDGPSARTMKNTLRLHSDQQPQVYELRCSIDDDPYLNNFVTINQMKATLGEVATVILPTSTQ